jgi:hypothetical protein
MLKGIKDCWINNYRRWFLLGVNKKRGKFPLTSVLDYGRVGDCIRAKYSSKFVADNRGRKSFEREKQSD